MSEQDPLAGDLNQIRREFRWAPLTPDEADVELANISATPLDDDVIDALVQSATVGDVLATTQKPADPWVAEDEIPDHDRHALLLNRAPDEGDEGLTEEPDKPSEQKASEEEDDDPPADAKPRVPN